ncbi:MAG: hypothetical protein U5L74_03470 [Ideonella sp.]|nr:hypothetical protein [Ideonella sp.]
MTAEEQLAAIDEWIQHVFVLAELSPKDRQEVIALRDEIQTMLDQPENVQAIDRERTQQGVRIGFDASLLLQGATEGRIQPV